MTPCGHLSSQPLRIDREQSYALLMFFLLYPQLPKTDQMMEVYKKAAEVQAPANR